MILKTNDKNKTEAYVFLTDIPCENNIKGFIIMKGKNKASLITRQSSVYLGYKSLTRSKTLVMVEKRKKF